MFKLVVCFIFCFSLINIRRLYFKRNLTPYTSDEEYILDRDFKFCNISIINDCLLLDIAFWYINIYKKNEDIQINFYENLNKFAHCKFFYSKNHQTKNIKLKIFHFESEFNLIDTAKNNYNHNNLSINYEKMEVIYKTAYFYYSLDMNNDILSKYYKDTDGLWQVNKFNLNSKQIE